MALLEAANRRRVAAHGPGVTCWSRLEGRCGGCPTFPAPAETRPLPRAPPAGPWRRLRAQRAHRRGNGRRGSPRPGQASSSEVDWPAEVPPPSLPVPSPGSPPSLPPGGGAGRVPVQRAWTQRRTWFVHGDPAGRAPGALSLRTRRRVQTRRYPEIDRRDAAPEPVPSGPDAPGQPRCPALGRRRVTASPLLTR